MYARVWKTAGLLLISNVFMTTAWYGHLRFPGLPLGWAVLGSWGLAFFEYLFQVPANRIGHAVLSTYQLKILQETITLVVFVFFAWIVFGERLTLRRLASLALLSGAVALAFAPSSTP